MLNELSNNCALRGWLSACVSRTAARRLPRASLPCCAVRAESECCVPLATVVFWCARRYWQFASMYSSGIAATKALSIGMAAGGLFPCILALLQHMDELGPGLHDISSFSTPNVMLWISSVIQALFIVLFIVIWRGNARRAAAIEADELEKQAAADDAAAEASGQVGAEDSDATAEWSDSSDDGLNKDAEGGRKTKRHRRSKRPSRPRGSEKSPANRLVHTPSSMAVVFDPVPSTSRRNSRTRSISGSENGPATDVYRSARRDKGRSSRASSRASWAEDLDRPLLGYDWLLRLFVFCVFKARLISCDDDVFASCDRSALLL